MEPNCIDPTTMEFEYNVIKFKCCNNQTTPTNWTALISNEQEESLGMC